MNIVGPTESPARFFYFQKQKRPDQIFRNSRSVELVDLHPSWFKFCSVLGGEGLGDIFKKNIAMYYCPKNQVGREAATATQEL